MLPKEFCRELVIERNLVVASAAQVAGVEGSVVESVVSVAVAVAGVAGVGGDAVVAVGVASGSGITPRISGVSQAGVADGALILGGLLGGENDGQDGEDNNLQEQE